MSEMNEIIPAQKLCILTRKIFIPKRKISFILILVSLTCYDLFLYIAEKKSNTMYWVAAVAVEFFVMLCAFEGFLYTKNFGLIFSAKRHIASSERNKEYGDVEERGSYLHLTL